MSDVMTVRAGSFDDAESILALEQICFAEDRLSRRALRRFLAKPERPVLVAGFGARVVGYAVLSMRQGGRACRIYSFAVDPAVARRGVGREIVGACERYARAHDFGALRLEARYDNAPAIALYGKLGFSEFGRYPAYYSDGAEALRFEKRLG